MKHFPAIFVAAGLACAGFSAQAKHQITSIVKKNASTDITDNFQYGANCSDAQFIETGYVTRKPLHGSVEIVKERAVLTQKRCRFPQKFPCIGATLTVQFVRYTPRPGYVGPDQFSVSRGNNPNVLTYRFNVK